MAYQALSLDGFLEEYRWASTGSHPRKFCFVLGAGASKTSGIKTGEDLVNLWDGELAQRNPEEHARWKRENAITDQNKYAY